MVEYTRRQLGRFLVRENRFAALVELESGVVRVHVPTTSRMRELLLPGAVVWVAACAHPGRVTGHTLLMVQHGEVLVSIDSGAPNRLLDAALRAGQLAEFAGWPTVRREVWRGESRLDFLLTRGEERCWIEAKSVTLVRDGIALFPDAPTARGARHLGELAEARAAGDRAAAVFIIQRNDAHRFAPNQPLDPAFAAALAHAVACGVEVYAYTCRVAPEAMEIAGRVEVKIG